jgi:hypothetical protein
MKIDSILKIPLNPPLGKWDLLDGEIQEKGYQFFPL